MKRNLKKVLFILMCFFLMSPLVEASPIVNICDKSDVLNIMKIIGHLIDILKIVGMLGLIVVGMIDFAKVIINDPDKDLKKAGTNFAKRCFAGVMIFLVPTILLWVVNLIGFGATSEARNLYRCTECMLNAKDCVIDETVVLEEEEVEEEPEVEIEEPENSNYHINSINKVKYMVYEQRDSRWADLPFAGSKGTGDVGERGCNIIATAVIVSAHDSKVTPYTIYHSGYRSAHPYNAINKLAKDTFKCDYVSRTNDEIIEGLKKGNVAVIVVYGKNKGGSSKFTSSQHYMSLIDISKDGSKIYVGNSFDNGNYKYAKSGWHNTSDVLTSVQQVHMCKVK